MATITLMSEREATDALRHLWHRRLHAFSIPCLVSCVFESRNADGCQEEEATERGDLGPTGKVMNSMIKDGDSHFSNVELSAHSSSASQNKSVPSCTRWRMNDKTIQ
ncbi:uncharacterized protein LOC107402249 [Peromyscus maniculatus bairdii]|uniref:uncharacterized protein LOC107402249 n=1 Tax=Peromyscus maniculatus bairdii TaxID=230844 RepID=UPI003FD0DD0C